MMATDARLRDDLPLPRLLIVEDDELIADLIAEAVEEHYDVSCIRTGAGACALLLAGAADVLLLDHHLLDGPATPVLRETDRLGVPALVMTGDPGALEGPEHRDRPLLAKPFGMVELLLALERVLRPSGRFASSGRACHPGPFRPRLRFVVGREDHEERAHVPL